MLHFNLFKKLSLFLLFCSIIFSAKAAYIFIPMDESQSNHLKAYGIAFYAIEREVKVDWLLFQWHKKQFHMLLGDCFDFHP